MHLLRGQPKTLTGDAEPVDLEQSPGDIVILTAADTEISGLAAARRALGEDFPSVRLANWMQLLHPYSVDLYAENVLAHAKLVVLRLLGGASYWRYGLDEAARLARANGARLVVIPGDATWDAALAAHGTVPEAEAQKLWSYLVEGGSENLVNALRFCAHLIGQGAEPDEAKPLPTAGVYTPANPDPLPHAEARAGGAPRSTSPPERAADRLLPRAAAGGADRAGRRALRRASRTRPAGAADLRFQPQGQGGRRLRRRDIRDARAGHRPQRHRLRPVAAGPRLRRHGPRRRRRGRCCRSPSPASRRRRGPAPRAAWRRPTSP